ncbi:o-succinylbenzoate synthase, partial [Haloferax sp. AB510]|nr:o-succinylbenzoate synthase [Haloferax sp. AB510]
MRLREFAVDLRTPLSTASGDIERREGLLVAVDVAGETGVGEATPLPGWTESLADCRDALVGLAEG